MMLDEEFDRACRFLYALVDSVQTYGVSSASMEDMLVGVARALKLEGQFLATPTQVQSILWQEDGGNQRLHISVTNAGDYDLNKLAQISELVSEVKAGETDPDAGLERLETIDRSPSEYNTAVNALAFALCGMGFAVILGVSWTDVLLAGLLSIVSFLVARTVGNSPGLGSAVELIVAFVATVAASLLALAFVGSNASAVAICACIYYVPGFGLTLGASELMAGNTSSGLIGFTRALVTSAKLVLGAMIGGALVGGWVTVPPPNVQDAVPHLWTWVFAPMLVLGLAILFRVRRSELVWPVLGTLIVWLGLELGAGLGFWQGTFLGAFLLLATSKAFARFSGLPDTIILLPVVMVLVPGVAALRALYTAQTEGIVEGLRSTSNVVVLIGAILGGILLAQAIWNVRQVAMSTIVSLRPQRESAPR